MDRPVALVCGRRGHVVDALVAALARQGYDVHLAWSPASDGWGADAQVAARVRVSPTEADVVARVRGRWQVAIIAGTSVRHQVVEELGEALHRRAETELLVVLDPRDQPGGGGPSPAPATGPVALAGRPRVTVVAPRSGHRPRRRGAGRTERRAGRTARQALEGLRQSRAVVTY